jgi:hypothetical protein
MITHEREISADLCLPKIYGWKLKEVGDEILLPIKGLFLIAHVWFRIMRRGS